LDHIDEKTREDSAGGDSGGRGAVETAYRQIRKAIITGKLRSGEPLQEARLAEKIGVSRTPIREALSRLSAEGLVVLERYRRGYVAHFSARDVAEVFRLRGTLEGDAAGRAALLISEDDIARLEALEEEMERIFEQLGWHNHLEAFDRLNTEFHMIIARASDSPRLVRLLASSLELPASIFNTYAEPVDMRTRRTHVQHREIIAALRARNVEWAQAAMSAHLFSLLVLPKEDEAVEQAAGPDAV
jgi:DNA-binding GntR family transcriptional regulator